MIANKLLLSIPLLLTYVSFAQVGINTNLPLHPLHVDPKKNNTEQLTAEQTKDDFVITKDGYVGIGTITPNATVDIASDPTNLTKVDGLIPPRITGDQLKAKEQLYNIEQAGSILYITKAVTASSPKTKNINSEGYYFFDGNVWLKLGSITADNGVNIDNNTVKLGGALSQSTTISTSIPTPLKITGLSNPTAGEITENVIILDDGTLMKLKPDQISGNLAKTIYIQGTDELTVKNGERGKVPGLQFTYTATVKQTLFFTVTGYTSKPGGGTVGSGQGVFELYQDNVKISSAYAAIADTQSGTVATNLVNLPIPATLLKSVTLT